MLVVILGVLALAVSGFAATRGLFAAGTNPTGPSAIAALWNVLMLVAVGAATPSVGLMTRGSASSAAIVTADERRRRCHLAELGAVAWMLLAAVWIFGAPLDAWAAAAPALSLLAGVACIPPSVLLFRAWARLRA